MNKIKNQDNDLSYRSKLSFYLSSYCSIYFYFKIALATYYFFA